MKDIFETEIKVGQIVAVNPPIYKGLVKAKVIKITDKQVRVSYKPTGKQHTTDFCVYPNQLVVYSIMEKGRKKYLIDKKL